MRHCQTLLTGMLIAHEVRNMIQFWFLWFFIAIVVVLVAFTLRKERDDMPRKDILRAVETNASGMGLAEKTFLWAFSWLDTRFRIQDYWGMSKNAYHSMHRQMPLTHAEKYKLRIIWYWYPLYCFCLLYTSPSPRDQRGSRMPSSA